MNRMTRIATLLLSLLMLAGTATACQTTGTSDDTAAADTTTASSEDTTAAPAPDTLPTTDAVTDAASETTAPAPVDPTPARYRPAEEVKVVSFNLDANASTASERAKRLIPLILGYNADSIGVQEARSPWGGLLRRYLQTEGYGRVGVDANGQDGHDSPVFATYILYKKDKYDVIDSGTFWMSKTPEVPSQYDSTVDCNRTCTWALFENKTTGFRYIHMNTHLDWMNMEVNKIQVAMIREQIERFEAMGYPVFATGDYNCDEGSASYKTMLESESIADSKHVADKTMNLGTYPSYGQYDVTVTKPIDFVFVTKNAMQVIEYKVIDEKPEGEYISDHNGLFVHAKVSAMPIRPEENDEPAFPQDANLSYTDLGGTAMDVIIPQAYDKDGIMAYAYSIELRAEGVDGMEQTVPSGVLRYAQPDTATARLTGLKPDVTYTVYVTPVSMLGTAGFTKTFKASLRIPVEPEEMGKADLFDLGFSDGKPVDVSPKGYAMTLQGIAEVKTVAGMNALAFTGAGHYKVPDYKENYTTMESGFTMEAYFKTGDEISTFQSLVSNMHAGGFGIDIENGEVQFSLRSSNGRYIGVKAPIEKNRTYHVVGVFDGSKVTIYLDGAEIASKPFEGQMTHPTAAGACYLCLGADSSGDGNGEYNIQATLFNARIYSAPASAGQALYLYKQTKQ